MLVMYSDGKETLVCEKKDEKRLLKEYFETGERDVDDYDRDESGYVFEITRSSKGLIIDPIGK